MARYAIRDTRRRDVTPFFQLLLFVGEHGYDRADDSVKAVACEGRVRTLALVRETRLNDDRVTDHPENNNPYTPSANHRRIGKATTRRPFVGTAKACLVDASRFF